MTIPNAPEPAASAEELLTQMAQQIAQASQTIAMHINQHDDAGQSSPEGEENVDPPGDAQAAALAQMEQHRQLQEMLAQMTRELGEGLQAIIRERSEQERAYRQTIEEAERQFRERDEVREERHRQELENLRAELRQAREENRADREALRRSHDEALADHVAALRREREEQGRLYEQLRTATVEETGALLSKAIDDNAKATQTALDQARERMNREQQENTSAAVDAVDARWRRLSRVVVGAAAGAGVIAVAALALALL